MTQQSTEERLALLEKEVQDLKQELAKRRTLEGLRMDVQELQERYQAHETYVSERLNDFESHVTTRIDVLEQNVTGQIQELRTGQQVLQAGQEQILALLTNKAPRND